MSLTLATAHSPCGRDWISVMLAFAFGAHDVPSTLFGMTVLGYDHQLVEIEAVAAVVD